MNLAKSRSALIAVSLAVYISTASAEPVSFIPLGDLAGGAFESRATALSADGTTVVGYSTSTTYGPAGAHEAFHWKNGVIQGVRGLGPPGFPGLFSRAFGVNGNGSMMTGQSANESSFFWTNGVLDVNFDDEVFPLNMAANGAWVGYTTFGPFHTAVSSSGNIPLLPGGDIFAPIASEALAISDNGTVVVGLSSYAPGFAIQAFRWTSATSTVGLGFLPGHNGSRATAVSGNGLLIGGTSGPGETPFLWTQNGGMVPFSGNFRPVSMSFDGSVIVGSNRVWDPVYGSRLLQDILTGAGINMTGWNIFEVTDVSADGLVVSGSATNPQGDYEGFRAVIPEPATGILLLLAASALLRRRRIGC